MPRRQLLVAAAGMALAGSLLIAPTTSAAGSTRYVDDDGHAGAAGCNSSATAKKTIQGAVDAANDGDTILVCPGTYTERVTVTAHRGLTLRSVKDWKAVIKNPAPDPATAGTSSSAPWMVGIYDAQDISVRGFKLVHRGYADCQSGLDQVGILFVAARDISIRSNRIVGTGDTLSECGLAAGIFAGFPFGVGSAAAAAAPAGLPADLTTTGLIAYNLVRDQAFLGIAAVSTVSPTAGAEPGPTRVDIRNNSIQYYHLDAPADACQSAPPAASAASPQLKRSLRAALRGLAPAGPGITCIGVGIYQGAFTSDTPPPSASGLISRNRISSGPDARFQLVSPVGNDAGTPAQAIGILVIDQDHEDGATTVLHNTVRRNGFGIVAIDAAGIRVIDNRVRETFFGIAVYDTEGGAVVRGNRALDSAVGIWADNEPFSFSPAPAYVTSDVLFKGNDANDNLDSSCRDDTTGTGTEGTANTWIDNDAEVGSSMPEGICGAKAP